MSSGRREAAAGTTRRPFARRTMLSGSMAALKVVSAASEIPADAQQGFRAIAVQFDVWGLSKLIHGSLTQARAAAKKVAAESNGESNGAKE